MKKVLFLIGLIFLVLSCTKVGKNVTVTGRVLNPITGEGIPNVHLKLLKGTNGLPGGFKSIKETFTDDEGYFEINKMTLSKVILQVSNTGDEPHYRIGWWLDTGYFSLASPYEIPVKKGKKMEAEYHMVPYGQMKISLHNVNCEGATDTLFYECTYLTVDGLDLFQPFEFSGCFNTDGAFGQVPSGDYLIEWTVKRTSGTYSYSHILTVPGNGEVEYNIDY